MSVLRQEEVNEPRRRTLELGSGRGNHVDFEKLAAGTEASGRLNLGRANDPNGQVSRFMGQVMAVFYLPSLKSFERVESPWKGLGNMRPNQACR